MSPRRVRIDSGRASVEGCPLSPENAGRIKELLRQHFDWLAQAELHLHHQESFTVTFIPKDDFWLASLEESQKMLNELANRLLHYLGSNPSEATVSLTGRK